MQYNIVLESIIFLSPEWHFAYDTITKIPGAVDVSVHVSCGHGLKCANPRLNLTRDGVSAVAGGWVS